MEKISKFLPLVVILFIFKNWFITSFLSARDWPYFFAETLSDFPLFPPSWEPTLGIGLGGEPVNYGLDSYVYLIVSLFVNLLGLPWELVYKVFIFGLFVALSVFSSTYLLKRVLDNPNSFQFLLSALIFTTNTYILMVVAGGQMGIALAYSIAPFVLARFIQIVNLTNSYDQNLKSQISNLKSPKKLEIGNWKLEIIRKSGVAGLVLAVQVMFDLRIAYITLLMAGFYMVFAIFYFRHLTKASFAYFLFPIFIVLVLHAHWLIPILVLPSYPVAELVSKFSSVEGFRFLSFATFSQTISLLHPNWPENIFGKTYFMRPEFLILPILAYSSLLFVRSSKVKSQNSKPQLKTEKFNNYLTIKQFNNEIMLFFSLLGLLGAFLAKGANDPFGEINTWIFMHMPFSALFRDPTKFYLLTALSYSILIPYALSHFAVWINLKRRILYHTCGVIVISYALFLINPVFLNQLNGTFKQYEVPEEYIELKDFLHGQKNFSRTLWIPTQQRYNYYSYMHPAVSANRIFSATNSAELVKKLSEEKASEFLSNLSIQYVIIPYDSFGEIFVKDRKYNEKEYLETIKLIDNIAWLKRVSGFDKIAVYEVSNYKDHFWIDGEGSFSYKSRGPAEYQLEISTKKPTTLIFAEKYSPYWVASIDGKNITSKSTQDNTNSFLLEKTGTYMVKVYFSKQQYYTYGRVITLVLLVIFLSLVILKKKNDL